MEYCGRCKLKVWYVSTRYFRFSFSNHLCIINFVYTQLLKYLMAINHPCLKSQLNNAIMYKHTLTSSKSQLIIRVVINHASYFWYLMQLRPTLCCSNCPGNDKVLHWSDFYKVNASTNQILKWFILTNGIQALHYRPVNHENKFIVAVWPVCD